MEHTEDNVVELIGEDGTPVLFEHLTTLAHGDKSYVLLTPAEPETPDEEGAVVIMRIDEGEEGEEDCYIVEEDEKILEDVFGRFMAIIEAEENEETEEDEEPEEDED